MAFFKTKLRVEFHLTEITQVCVCMCVCVHAHAKLSKGSDHFLSLMDLQTR